ncbi:hypothetical protein OA57_04910 [Chelonobacter oris]|uniref:Membrane transport protein MMPL domain-containing protein n=1 Tax=Chelonobacter oris TaxID=505317 RepID=A0A0A3AUH9_9PAST|nr:hypothetical protein [Chelonobacter oris]KGQ70705.1 hypothetical protein OA57_04910 [Chelonobacter oris]
MQWHTALAYALLFFAPSTVLQQMAVYAVFGLFGALLTIYLFYPYFIEKMPYATFVAQTGLYRYLHFWRENCKIIPLMCGVVPLLLYAAIQIQFNDDVRTFQRPTESLKQMERQVTAILGQSNQLQYFILQADNQESLLQRSEQLKSALQQAKLDHAYRVLLSDYVPSRERKQRNAILVSGAVQTLTPALTGLGLQQVQPYPETITTLTQFMDSALGGDFQSLYFQKTQGSRTIYYLLVPLQDGEQGKFSQIASETDGVSYHNLTQQWSVLFGQTRNAVLWMLSASAVLVCLCLAYGFSIRFAGMFVFVIAFSMLCSLAVLSLSGQYFNVFSALGLALVLGMSVDYAIFLAKSRTASAGAFLAILLSAVTSLLSFGLLMFSQTQALASFAMTVSVGISIAFFYAAGTENRD